MLESIRKAYMSFSEEVIWINKPWLFISGPKASSIAIIFMITYVILTIVEAF